MYTVWPFKTDREAVGKMQAEDPDVGPVYQGVYVNTKPSRSEVNASSQAAYHYMRFWKNLVIEDGLLFRLFYKKGCAYSYYQLLVPKKLTQEALKAVHELPDASHSGVRRTTEKLLKQYYWFEARQDVKTYIKNCETCCSVRGPSKQNISLPMEKVPSEAQLDLLSVDSLNSIAVRETISAVPASITLCMNAADVTRADEVTTTTPDAATMTATMTTTEMTTPDATMTMPSGPDGTMAGVLRNTTKADTLMIATRAAVSMVAIPAFNTHATTTMNC